MSSVPRSRPTVAARVVGVLVLLVGLVLAAGGAWLAALGGSWYYVLAGVGMTASGALLFAGRGAGASLYALVLVASLLWAAWESGLDYWRWIPRAGLVVGFGILVALVAPRLSRGPSKRVAYGAAGVLGAVFAVAFALAFVPHGVTAVQGAFPQAAASAGAASDGADAGDWPAYGRTYGATRYSPLAQITRDNVSGLERAWTFRTGDLPGHRWGAETTPLKVGDRLFLCTGRNQLIALDARSGKEVWRYDPKVADDAIPYTAACRGVAYYAVPAVPAVAGADAAATAGAATDEAAAATAGSDAAAATTATSSAPASTACATRVIEGTLDGRIIAVDAATGVPCAGFGDNGQVSITTGMGEGYPGFVSITSPPTIVQGVIVTGHQVLDGQRIDMPSGVIKGFDAMTGELRWAWDLARPEISQLPPEGETYGRSTPNMWTTATGDEQLGLVYLPMGNHAGDYWSTPRDEFSDEYATSLVALDVNTGKPAWHFQTVRHDVWDYDLGSQATLIDFPTANGPVPALVLPSKQGDMYVLDRRTGKPLTDVGEIPVPQGGVEPARRVATQPVSGFHTLRKPDLTERDMWGLTPIDQLVCRIQFRRASYDGYFTPPTTGQYSIQYPGYNGGSDWGGIAIDPARGVIVANYNDMPNYNLLVPRAKADSLGWASRDQVRGDMGGAEGAGDPQVGAPYAINVNAGWRLPFTKLLCKEPPYGGIRAVELATGRTLWDRPFGTARKNGPFGLASHMPIDIGTPNNGGSVISASGLVFIAAATDDLIRAIDIETGKTVWSDVLPAGGQANPMLYSIDGREYLVIMAGGHHFMETPEGDYVIAYALPKR